MCAYVLNKPNRVNSFRLFRDELMNVETDYNDDVKKVKTSYRISGVEVEEEKLVIRVSQKMKFRDAFRKKIVRGK